MAQQPVASLHAFEFARVAVCTVPEMASQTTLTWLVYKLTTGKQAEGPELDERQANKPIKPCFLKEATGKQMTAGMRHGQMIGALSNEVQMDQNALLPDCKPKPYAVWPSCSPRTSACAQTITSSITTAATSELTTEE